MSVYVCVSPCYYLFVLILSHSLSHINLHSFMMYMCLVILLFACPLSLSPSLFLARSCVLSLSVAVSSNPHTGG